VLGFLGLIIEKRTIYRPFALAISIFILSFYIGAVPVPSAQATEADPESPSEENAIVNELVTPGGDDVSYRIPLEVPIIFDGVSYIDVYATTNSVITFGQPDGTFHDYPMTPSVSLQARDWWARPYMGDEWFIIRTSSGGFQVDGSYRPYGTNSGPITNIVITAQILTNGTVSYTYSVVGPLYGGERTGARLNDGTVATLEQVGVEEVEEPVVLEPEPVPEPEPEPETEQPTPPTIPDGSIVASEGTVVEITAPEGQRIVSIVGYYGDPNDSTRGGEVSSILSELSAGLTSVSIEVSNTTFGSDPAPGTPKILIYLVTYENIPVLFPVIPPYTPGPVNVPPTFAEPEETPLLLPELTQPTSQPDLAEPLPEPTSEDLLEQVLYSPDSSIQERVDAILANLDPGEVITLDVLLEAGIDLSDLPPETPVEIRTDENGNPVIITAEQASQLSVFGDVNSLIEAAFNDLGALVGSLQHVGKDMTEEEREESQAVVVSSVIVGNMAYLASNAAAISSVVTYRRKP
jgi:hypothetical protein